MQRQLIKIDEALCNGCGDCVTGCAEGALQIIDEKARLISDLLCDGLGACIGQCPMGAISFETREAEPYQEERVIAEMAKKGKNTVVAHLRHLADHGQTAYVDEAVTYLRAHLADLTFDLDQALGEATQQPMRGPQHGHQHGGCPGSRAMSFEAPGQAPAPDTTAIPSALRQWPVQLHLVNPLAPYFQKAHVLVAADCVAYALGDFHRQHLAGKSLVIACPKLDANQEVYVDKITRLADDARVTQITIMIMEVPCCNGLVGVVRKGLEKAQNKVPLTVLVVGIQGGIVGEQKLGGLEKPRSLLLR